MQTTSLGTALGLYGRFHPSGGRHPAAMTTRAGKVFDHAGDTTPTLWDWGAAWVSHYRSTEDSSS